MATAVKDNRPYGRFRFVHEPLTAIDKNEETHRPDFPMAGELTKRRYPIRALRYWWLSRVIEEEAARMSQPPVIADVGCDRGIIKRFIPPIHDAKWIGLDIDTNREGIGLAGYDELVTADFDEPLPLPDGSVDIAILSHVLEHLPRPEFTLRELNRIVRPGGLLLVGVPTTPKIIAIMCERSFAKQVAAGTRCLGQHIHVFWSKRLRQLAEKVGFKVEFCVGTALLRNKGSKLEDYALWIRFNQAFAALLPSFAQELCLQLRKPN